MVGSILGSPSSFHEPASASQVVPGSGQRLALVVSWYLAIDEEDHEAGKKLLVDLGLSVNLASGIWKKLSFSNGKNIRL